MERGTTIRFEASAEWSDADSGELVLNVTEELHPLKYYLDILEAAGYQSVAKREIQLDTWESTSGTRTGIVRFLFAEGVPLPIASSTQSTTLDRLKKALDFMESSAAAYTIKDLDAPTPS